MRRRLGAIAAGLALIVAGAAIAAPRSPAAGEDEVAILRAAIDEAGGSGAIAAALLDGDSTRFLSAGRSDSPAAPEVDEHTLFQIASVTKTFTALLLAEAVARGEVTLDERLDAILPDRTGTREGGAGSITLLDLATHTSGLPRVPRQWAFIGSAVRDRRDPYRHYTEADLDAYLATMRRSADRSFAYSNLGFGLLGKALERASGRSYGALIEDRVARPLGLRSTFVEVPDRLRDRVAVGHDQDGETPPWSLSVFAGAGAVWSTAEDLAIYVRAHRDLTPPVDASLFTPRVAYDLSDREVGLAWVIDHRRGDELVWHNGRTGGFSSFIGFSRKSGRGVVVLAGVSTDLTDVGLHLLNRDFPLHPAGHGRTVGIIAVALQLFAALLNAARASDRAERLARRIRLVPRGIGRMETLAAALGGVAFVRLCWHVTPWMTVGGLGVRYALALAVGVSALFAIARARSRPWFGAEGWRRRIGVGISLAISLALLALAFAFG